MAKIKILSFNAKGIKEKPKRCEVFRWCKSHNPDILFIQEAHSSKDKENEWYDDWGEHIFYSHGQTNKTGVCICFRRNLNFKVMDDDRDSAGRILVLDVIINDLRMTLVNLHAPNGDTPAFFEEVFDKINKFDNSSVIMGGDYNLVFNVNLDKMGGNPTTHEKCRQLLIAYMDELSFHDVWRKEHPDRREFTYKSYSVPHIFCRLDFFLVSQNLWGVTSNNKILPGYKSDHDIVQTIINTSKETRGPGFWKLNCELLNHPDYTAQIEECIDNTVIDNPGTEASLLWDTIKCRIRGQSVKFSANLKRIQTAEKKS